MGRGLPRGGVARGAGGSAPGKGAGRRQLCGAWISLSGSSRVAALHAAPDPNADSAIPVHSAAPLIPQVSVGTITVLGAPPAGASQRRAAAASSESTAHNSSNHGSCGNSSSCGCGPQNAHTAGSHCRCLAPAPPTPLSTIPRCPQPTQYAHAHPHPHTQSPCLFSPQSGAARATRFRRAPTPSALSPAKGRTPLTSSLTTQVRVARAAPATPRLPRPPRAARGAPLARAHAGRRCVCRAHRYLAGPRLHRVPRLQAPAGSRRAITARVKSTYR